MSDSGRWQKLSSSPIFIFILGALFFGIFMQLGSGEPFSLSHALIIGLPFGVVIAIANKIQMNKLVKDAGVSNIQKYLQLRRAAFKGELPTDSETKKALPAYLRQQHQQYHKHQKFSQILIPLLILFYIPHIIMPSSPGRFAFSAVLIALFTWSYFAMRRTATNVENLGQQLGVDLNKSIEKKKELDSSDKYSPDAKARTVSIVGAVVVLILAFTFWGNETARSDKSVLEKMNPDNTAQAEKASPTADTESTPETAPEEAAPASPTYDYTEPVPPGDPGYCEYLHNSGAVLRPDQIAECSPGDTYDLSTIPLDATIIIE